MVAWEIFFVLGLLVAALASFIWERISTDLTALLVFSVLLIGAYLPFTEKLPAFEELLGVFANPAPLAIAALFILSAALEKCGIIDFLAQTLGHLTRFGYKGLLIIMIFLVATISAFINNTPVVVIFMPVVLTLSRKMQTPASKLLIPLSYASIFGGVCTLVGTSTNILASGIMREAGYAELSMFELSRVGVPLLFLATAYLVVFAHRRLPVRESLTAILSEEERKEYFTEAYIRKDSPLIGQKVEESDLMKARGLRLIEVVRGGISVPGNVKEVVLRGGDRLVLACRPSGFARARSVEGLRLAAEEREGIETITAHEGSIVEGIIGPRSGIIGKTIDELNFRQRFRMIILAIHRRGINMRDRIDRLPLEPGDTLLLMGTESAREQIRHGDDIMLLDQPHTPSQDLRRRAPVVLAVMAGIILTVSFNILPITAAAIIGVGLVLVAGVLTPKEAYQSIDWSILILIYGMLALGMAMETSGVTGMVADLLAGIRSIGWPELPTLVLMLACLYLATSIFTETLSNNATVVLMAPIAIQLGVELGIDPRPFLIAVCVASSASFSTPIGYQTNTYVYSVGGYRFADFLRIGLPLNFLYFAGTVVLVPLLWPFGN